MGFLCLFLWIFGTFCLWDDVICEQRWLYFNFPQLPALAGIRVPCWVAPMTADILVSALILGGKLSVFRYWEWRGLCIMLRKFSERLLSWQAAGFCQMLFLHLLRGLCVPHPRVLSMRMRVPRWWIFWGWATLALLGQNPTWPWHRIPSGHAVTLLVFCWGLSALYV